MAEHVMDITPRERPLLSAMRARPAMYAGEFSLSKIQVFLSGCQGTLRSCGLEEQKCILIGELRGFVTKRYSQPRVWHQAILKNTPDVKKAIETFFSLLNEFLAATGYEKIGAVKVQEARDEA